MWLSLQRRLAVEEDRLLAKRLHRLEEKIEAARKEELRETAETGDAAVGSGLTRAIGLSAEVVAAVGVGVVMGIGLDWLLGTGPWLLILFFMLGFAAGVLNLIREARRISSSAIQ
jgi:ATP synthase protein I